MAKATDLQLAGKLLVVVGAAVSVGLLPKGWQKGVSAATCVLILLKLLAR
ncbi:hypothetical protein ABIB25_000962 [Nakamurella sp. UYEF19]